MLELRSQSTIPPTAAATSNTPRTMQHNSIRLRTSGFLFFFLPRRLPDGAAIGTASGCCTRAYLLLCNFGPREAANTAFRRSAASVFFCLCCIVKLPRCDALLPHCARRA